MHRRCFTGKRTTEEAQMSGNHLEYFHSKGQNVAFYLGETKSIYPRKAVEKVLASPKNVSHVYRSCEDIFALRRKYGKARLENACRHVPESETVIYNIVRSILG